MVTGIFMCYNILYCVSRNTWKHSLEAFYLTASTDNAHWLPLIASEFYLIDTLISNAP